MDDSAQGPRPSDDPGQPRELVGEAGSPVIAPSAHAPSAVLSLKQAMRRARFDDAERSGVVADLRAARLGRLELLREALKPLIAQIPDDVDYFDVGIMPGSNPRLFIDMIGFVEMARDPRVYRFLQDTRHGRIKIAESETVAVIVEAATDYVARRLLERDKALAAAAEAPVDDWPAKREPASMPRPSAAAPPVSSVPRAKTRTLTEIAGMVFAFVIDVLGSVAFFALLAAAAWVVWSNLKL